MNATAVPSADTPAAKLAFQLYVAIGVAVLLLMMIAGALFRATQAAVTPIPANFAYELMTLHGAGMVGVSGLAGAAVMWYFLRRYVTLSTGMFLAMLGLSLVGVVMILAAIGIGRFAGGVDLPLPAAREEHGRLGPARRRRLRRRARVHRRRLPAVLPRLRARDPAPLRQPVEGAGPRPALRLGTARHVAAADGGREHDGRDHQRARHTRRRRRARDEPHQHLRPDGDVRRAAHEEPHLLLRARLHQRHHLHGGDRGLRDRAALYRAALERSAGRSSPRGPP